MEHPKKPPERHGDLHDPKLPQIHSGMTGDRAEQRNRP